MKPDRFEISSQGRRRLSGSIQQRGSRMGVGTWVGFLFGIPFVAAGIAIILVGTGRLRVDPSSIHAPYWVLTVAGLTFLLGGLMVWAMATKQFAGNCQRRRASRQFPDEPAFADYPWYPEGFEVSEWVGAAKTVAWAIALSVFLSMFNWWAFGANGPLMVKITVVLFDCLALGMWWLAARQLGRALKFGRSRVTFTRFPYRVNERVVIRWQPLGGIGQIRKGTFTLRCVEEWTERSGTGKNQSARIVHEELWSAKWVLETPRNFQLKDTIDLEYELPLDAHATRLSAGRPVFWELEANLDLPGLDFNASYLVPIYGPKAAFHLKPIPAIH